MLSKSDESEQPLGEDLSRAVLILGAQHIPEDAPKPTYNSNPPTSGPHFAIPAHVGFYVRELPDERVIHNMEHGDVWISYKPSIPQEVKDALRAVAEKDIKVIVTSRAANDTQIALASWGRIDTFDLEDGALDLARVKGFILRYKNKGPESVIDSGSHLPK